MAAGAGRKMRISYDSGVGMAVIAGARTDGGSIANEPIIITDKDDLGIQKLIDDVGTQALTLNVEGVLKDTTLLELAVDAADGAALHNFQLDLIGLGILTCADGFFITNFDPTGAEGSDPATFSCGLTSSGAITFTAAV